MPSFPFMPMPKMPKPCAHCNHHPVRHCKRCGVCHSAFRRLMLTEGFCGCMAYTPIVTLKPVR